MTPLISRPAVARTTQPSPRPDLRRHDRGSARTRLLAAGVDLIRRRGLSDTSVDDLCRAAGVTKGAFFHHFATKEALAIALAEHWGDSTGALFEAADYHRYPAAADRVLAYLDLRRALIQGEPAAYSCVAGTMVQEAYATSPDIRDACAATIFGHVATLVPDIATALTDAGRDDIDADSVARYTQAVLQGAFVLAKAADDAGIVIESIDHLRRDLETLFTPTSKEQR